MRLPRRVPSLPQGRHVLAAVLLVAHTFAATGAPIPSLRPLGGEPESPYPCRHRACGCQTSKQCWAGDCCCFTLEQKLAWADARGFEPPASARAAAEARKATPPKKPKRSCCRGEDEPSLPVAACSGPTCDRDAARAANSDDTLTVIWVAGVRAQKCRGEGPAGLLKLDPAVPPAADDNRPVTPEPDGFARPASVPPVPISQQPPARPPRS